MAAGTRCARGASAATRTVAMCPARRQPRPCDALVPLLANPEDAGHPEHIAFGEATAGCAADRSEFDPLTGLPNQLLGHEFAVARLDDDAVAATDLGVRRHDHHVSGPVDRGQG